jgi:AhpD family alkylhydroperoxidase
MSELDNKEKALVALAAAMAAGCTRCAEKLHPMGLEAGASADEIEWALYEGLRARESATAVMRRKAEALLDRPLKLAGLGGGPGSARVAVSSGGRGAAAERGGRRGTEAPGSRGPRDRAAWPSPKVDRGRGLRGRGHRRLWGGAHSGSRERRLPRPSVPSRGGGCASLEGESTPSMG